MIRSLVAVLLLVASPVVVRAALNPCFGENNDVPCTGLCVATGRCQDGVCAPIETVPDGTRCAAADFCSGVQECQAGVCTTVAPRVCPDVDECHVGRCDVERGCVVDTICAPPDLLPPPVDLLSPPTFDLAPAASPLDLDAPDPNVDLDVAAPDLESPRQESLDLGATPAEPDLALGASPDLGATPDGLASPADIPQVRGSNVALFCSVGSFAAPLTTSLAAGVVLLLLAATLLVVRARRTL